ncbi:uncharacterized protein P174DRAFT_11069 [Aspergillus novofumigatus IBT 16806]|uniref:Uncharacterized protein n=1 Tax=Aspergillus novofumigatus (strain IBT 16806) TaxID=1392255 RepID=A0A2I1CKZ4_ASPN1|nr:uncharacterized protein P174DRAFT_11069 [Aspergillus novofumigatus IBT 16806]PKX98290.1 hypothetical protein P174DRAFT_11069 [Aspergillus novofumigatus IBT 16806]
MYAQFVWLPVARGIVLFINLSASLIIFRQARATSFAYQPTIRLHARKFSPLFNEHWSLDQRKGRLRPQS